MRTVECLSCGLCRHAAELKCPKCGGTNVGYVDGLPHTPDPLREHGDAIRDMRTGSHQIAEVAAELTAVLGAMRMMFYVAHHVTVDSANGVCEALEQLRDRSDVMVRRWRTVLDRMRKSELVK